MNQQNSMAATAAANLVQGIATTLYGEAGADITDLITLANRVQAGAGALTSAAVPAAQADSAPEAAWNAMQAAGYLFSGEPFAEAHEDDQAVMRGVAAAVLAARQTVGQESFGHALIDKDGKVIAVRRFTPDGQYVFTVAELASCNKHCPSAAPFTAQLIYAAPPAQGIELGSVREIRIPARNKLDPISVFVQDQAVGRGRIVVTCYGNAWQGFWNAIGDRTVMQFVAQCDPDYVAGSMLQGRQTRIAKHERDYATRIAAEVIAEFRTLIDGQRDAAPGVGS